jgi:hypothetical protein
VKIRGTCVRDGREFLVEQAVANGGKCPWDGEPFQADYAVTLVDALREAEEFGARLEEALGRVVDVHPAFTIDRDSVLAGLRATLDRADKAPAPS